MIEGFAREMPESLMAEAIAKAHEYVREICEMQEELAAEGRHGQGRRTSRRRPDPLLDTLREKYFDELTAGQADRRQAGPGRGRGRAEGAGPGRD